MEPILPSDLVSKSLLASNPDSSALKGKSILITGAAQGLGESLAESYAAAGAFVTIADLKVAEGQALCSKLQSKGYQANFIHCDVTKWNDQVQAFKSAIRFSPSGDTVDHVIINAGVMDTPFFTARDEPLKSLNEDPQEPDARPIEVNTRGAMFSLKLAQLYMTMTPGTTATSRGSKSVLFMLSPESYITLPGSVIYGGSKFGARGLFRNARVLLATQGIRINAIVPWLMETPMNAGGPFLEILNSVGISTVSLEAHVKVATHLLSNGEIAGRAVALGQPEGVLFDVEDDMEGGDGSKRYWEMLYKNWPDVPKRLQQMFAMLGLEVDEKYAVF